MNEAMLLTRIRVALQHRLVNCAVIFKHCDRVTRGIPDLSVTCNGQTVWLEVKLMRNGAIKVDPIQVERMKRLQRYGHAYYVIGYQERSRGSLRFVVVLPSVLSTGHHWRSRPNVGNFDSDLDDLLIVTRLNVFQV